MSTHLETAYIIWSFVNSAILLFIAIYTWLSNRDKASKEAIAKVGENVSHIDNRVGKLEEAIKHVPDDHDLDVLHKRITEVSESQKNMQGELHQMNLTLGRIHEYLLNHRESR